MSDRLVVRIALALLVAAAVASADPAARREKLNGYVTLRSGKIFHGGIDDTEAWTEGGEPRGENARADAPDAPVQTGSRAAQSDRFIVLDGQSDGDYAVADRAIAFLRKHKDRPFFLGCGFSKPHSPAAAPRRFYDLYPLEAITLPPDFAPRPTVPPGFPRLSIRPRNADLFIDRDATPAQAKEMIRAYLASVSWMDWNLGRVIAELDRLGLRETTPTPARSGAIPPSRSGARMGARSPASRCGRSAGAMPSTTADGEGRCCSTPKRIPTSSPTARTIQLWRR